jgi:hypothetical protein
VLQSIGAVLYLTKLTGRLLFLMSTHLAIVGAAVASECDEHPSHDAVGVYIEWSDVPEDKVRRYDRMIVDQLMNQLDDDETAMSICTLTPVTFTPLRDTNLYNRSNVRSMLKNSRVLSNGETLIQKIENRRITFLIFVKFDSAPESTSMRIMSVRLDKAREYPNNAFVDDISLGKSNEELTDFAFNRAPERIMSTFNKIRRLTEQAERETKEKERFLVLVTCFTDSTGRATIGSWPVKFLKADIPGQLVNELSKEKERLSDKFMVEFEGLNCPRNDNDVKEWVSKHFARYYGDQHWFAWVGFIYMSGDNDLIVALEFVHYVKDDRRSTTEKIVEETVNVPLLAKRIARCATGKWEAYLKDLVAPLRPEWPLADRGPGTLMRPQAQDPAC